MATPQTTGGGAGCGIEGSRFEPVLVPRAFASFGHLVGETRDHCVSKKKMSNVCL